MLITIICRAWLAWLVAEARCGTPPQPVPRNGAAPGYPAQCASAGHDHTCASYVTRQCWRGQESSEASTKSKGRGAVAVSTPASTAALGGAGAGTSCSNQRKTAQRAHLTGIMANDRDLGPGVLVKHCPAHFFFEESQKSMVPGLSTVYSLHAGAGLVVRACVYTVAEFSARE